MEKLIIVRFQLLGEINRTESFLVNARHLHLTTTLYYETLIWHLKTLLDFIEHAIEREKRTWYHDNRLFS